MERPFPRCSSNSTTNLKKKLRRKEDQRGRSTDIENKILVNTAINMNREMIKGEDIQDRTITTESDLIHLPS